MSVYNVPFIDPSTTESWTSLKSHSGKLKTKNLIDLFNLEQDRIGKLTFEIDDLLIDLSKNYIQFETVNLLLSLAKETYLEQHIQAMFNGLDVNTTERRPALHTALRSKNINPVHDNIKIQSQIEPEFNKCETLSNLIRQKEFKGFSDKPINTIVNIGIGGSDLGPKLVCDAVKPYSQTDISCYFVSNIDFNDLKNTLVKCNPETTLFIVSSKSFTTLETLTNARSAKNWLEQNGCNDFSKHFIAITSNSDAAKEFGVDDNNIFEMWSWVGGRYSVWSAIGLSIIISIGMDGFNDFLAGASVIDNHFQTMPLSNNIPVLLGLIDVWYRNFLNINNLAIVPYDHNLKLLPDYLSQLIMESNGKHTDRNGNSVDYLTSPIVWGSEGTNGQHAFFQHLHQGTEKSSIDFLIGINDHYNNSTHQQQLVANCLAQSKALMLGKQKKADDKPYQHYPGNQPSTILMYDLLTPKTIGMLLAIYEHRTFVQGCIYNINSFDQWGVELGKKLSSEISNEINSEKIGEHDPSTRNLLQHFLKTRR